MKSLPADALAETTARERAFWEKTHAIIDRLRKLISLHLDEHELEHTSTLAREALRSLATLAKVEDKAAIQAHLVNAHLLIQNCMKESKLLEVALEELIHKPSPATLRRFDMVLSMFETVENKKLEALDDEIKHFRAAYRQQQ